MLFGVDQNTLFAFNNVVAMIGRVESSLSGCSCTYACILMSNLDCL